MKARTLFSLLLCLVLVFSLTLPVFAEGTDKSENDGITLTNEGDQGDGNQGGEGGGDQGGEGGGDQGGESGGDQGSEDKPHEHVWELVEITREATCAQEGIRKVRCQCGATEEHTIPRLSHTYTNGCDPDCNVCGATRTVYHSPGDNWLKNASGHWHVCSVCGQQVDMGDHYPGPAATQDRDQICLTCGYVLTRKLSHVHKYKTVYSSDESGHWYECEECGDRKDFEAHTFENPCDSKCTVCGFERENAHTYGNEFQYDEEYHWNVCTLCGNEGDHVLHVPGDPATEDSPQVCEVCGKEFAPPLNHVHEVAEWTHDEQNHEGKCSCGMTIEEGPHTWDAGVDNPDGTVTFTCTKCGAQKVEGEPKLTEGEFPWILVVGGVALLCAVSAAVVLVVVLVKKPKGRYAR